ncbi:MAG: hypothetical protein GC190_12055 [Alphaproteobacteria bacterium]|nr:hypothetical protein [Alphaproteobacteria bacterium]
MRFTTLLIAAAALFAFVLPAQAKSIPSAGLTRGEVATYLKSKGYPVTATKDGNGLSILKATTPAGVNFDIYFFDCNKVGRCPSIQFAAGWSVHNKVPLDRLNSWNRGRRYMRAYTQEGGALYGEVDMILAPGGSYQQFESYRTLWDKLLVKFKDHFGL